MNKEVVAFKKQITLTIDDKVYPVFVDRYSSLVIELDLDFYSISVRKQPRGGYPLYHIPFDPDKQLNLFKTYDTKNENEENFLKQDLQELSDTFGIARELSEFL